jgi:hypothetical protein
MQLKIKQDVFASGVRIHGTGDIVEVGQSDATKYQRRGWGDPYTAPKGAAAEVDPPEADDKGKAGGKGKAGK